MAGRGLGGAAIALALCAGTAAVAEAPPPSAWQALQQEIRSRGRIGGGAQMQWAYGVREPTSQYVQFEVVPEVQFRFPYGVDFTSLLRFRGDAFDRLEPGQPPLLTVSEVSRRRFWGDHVDFDLREAYFEFGVWKTLWTLGKQQIVWGKADGLKVLDIVNPQTFREFILDDFDDSRTPLWAANLEVPLGDWIFQLVWIPDKSYHDFAEPGALYQITSPQLIPQGPPGLPVELRDPVRPERFWQDSDVGARIGAFLGGWDLTLNYLYVYDDVPVFVTDLALVNGLPTAIVTPSYARTHVIGGTFSNAFGDVTVRGELAYYTRRFVSTSDVRNPGLVAPSGEFSYVIGLDWFGFTDTLVSAQVFQSVLIEDIPGAFERRLDTNLTLLVRRDFWNDTLHAEGIWIVNAHDGDGLVRGEIAYDWNDHLSLWVGFDVFYGDQDGIFGEFDANDRIIMGIRVGL